MKKILYIIPAIILLAACTEEFPVELESTNVRLVVQGSISDELKAHTVYLSKSSDYFSNTSAPKVTGAIVSITDGENTFSLTEISPGTYQTDTIAGETGKTYTLNIESEGHSYTASSYLNACAPIDSIKFGYYDYGNFYEVVDTIIYILMYALEPATPNNFYLWNVYKNGVLDSDTLDEVVAYDDEFVNGNYMYDLEVQWFYGTTGDTITLEMQSIPEDYYNYIYQVLYETVWDMGPFDGPPANPKGNISNDALGFFWAYSVQRQTAIVPKNDDWILLEWY